MVRIVWTVGSTSKFSGASRLLSIVTGLISVAVLIWRMELDPMELLLNRPEGEFSRLFRLLLRLMVLLSLHCWKGWGAQLVEVVV